jgi:dolichol-phosphate mannosyltransferase
VVVAMTSNFFINNVITYRDSKLRGFVPILRGLAYFYLVCLIGAVANIGVAEWIYKLYPVVSLSALAGVIMGSVWNFTLSSLFVWRKD